MQNKFFRIFLFIVSGFVILNCTQNKKTGEEEAKRYCSSCHLFPEPFLLDKITWKRNVLPAMGKLLGAQQLDQNPFEESDRIMSHEKSSISSEDWKKIIDYYVFNAPNEMPAQPRPVITKITSLFTAEKKIFNVTPASTFLKIDPGNNWIYVAAMDSSLTIFDKDLNIISKRFLDGIVVDMFFNSSWERPGKREGVMTQIGIMNPNDLKTGSGEVFTINAKGELNKKKMIDTLPRPVQTISTDLDTDGRIDYLVCGFGNKEGSFFWMQNKGDGKFEQKMLRPLPGAVKAYIDDFNADGLPDIVALFAQAQEGINVFINKGNGVFETKEILRFSPVHGSTFFKLVDFNGDGKKDILFTCGDNADYSKVLKNYHGIYIYLNQGDFTFKQQFFFPLHGAFKALARDFDKDGDLDIAAISYFPDNKDQPMEAFVLLEQTSAFHFIPYSIREYNEGHWITMDAGDMDGDGDEDIVIGSLFLPNEILQSKENLRNKPSFLLLKNNVIKN